MAISLYDLLEVSQSASPDAIATNYKRLHLKYSEIGGKGEEDAVNHLVALREAFSTLSNPERRKRYDIKLATEEHPHEIESSHPSLFPRLLVFAIILGASGVGYTKYQADKEKARLESGRVIAATKTAELEAEKERQERENAERKAAIERASRDRDIAYGNQISRNIQRAEADSRWQQQREEQQRNAEERQKQYEAERQLAREKAYLRKLEAENGRYSRY
jgi:curved DNA-binding protein CbpA